MRDPRRGPEPEHVAAAALVGVPFALYVAVVHLVSPPTREHWAHADPILGLVPEPIAMWGPPLAGFGAALAWARFARPSRAVLVEASREALLGALVAGLAVVALRLAVGEHLPAFIPSEESARPGFGLSMSAGYLEEVACRLVLLPALHFGLRGRLAASPLVAIALTGLAFSCWHAAGEGSFQAAYFVTRFVMPGCLMSAVWMASPSAIVVGHATAHLLIPALFL